MSQRDRDQLTVYGIDFLVIRTYETIIDVGESWIQDGKSQEDETEIR